MHVTSTPTERWLALDVMRAVAVVLMVQGHAFRLALRPAFTGAWWYSAQSIVHGFTAPMFLYGAGLAWGLTTFRDWDAHARLGEAPRRRMLRYATLIALGYVLQFPSLSLHRALVADRLRDALCVGPLQVIGIVLGGCELAAIVLRRRGRLACGAALVAVAVLLFAPIVEGAPLDHFPLPLVALLDARTGSTFPLFPWAAFPLLGIVTMHVAWDEGARAPRRGLGLGLGLAGALAIALTTGLFRSGVRLYGVHDFWLTDPIFMVFRIGVVAVLLALLTALAAAWNRTRPALGTRVTRTIGEQSLVVYVGHLLVLYGSPLWHAARSRIGERLDPVGALAFSLLLVVAMVVLALTWKFLATRRRALFDALRFSLTGLLVYFLLAA